jgi:hypothetical protein
MLLLFLSMALANAQQAQHDQTEWAMYRRLQADKETISEMWRPDGRLPADYRKAHKCYVQFHLYRVANCDAELAKVDLDLGDLELARTESR